MSKLLSTLELEEIDSFDILRALLPEWEELWRQSNSTTPFQSPHWLLAWLTSFGEGKQLWVLALRNEGRLVGLAPFCILREGDIRKLLLIGIGISDCVDGLFAPGFEEEGVQLVFTHLVEHTERWDVCDLQPLLPESALLSSPLPAELDGVESSLDPWTTLDLPQSIAEFRSCLSSHFRERLDEARRRAGRIGPIDYELAGEPTFEKSFEHLVHLHHARWGTGVITDDSVVGFLREIASKLLACGSLRLFVMTVGDHAVAALYGFAHRQRFYFYLSGFDPEFQKASPGVLLITHAIEQAISEGATACEFLRGREPYKFRWGVRERATFARRLSKRK